MPAPINTKLKDAGLQRWPDYLLKRIFIWGLPLVDKSLEVGIM